MASPLSPGANSLPVSLPDLVYKSKLGNESYSRTRQEALISNTAPQGGYDIVSTDGSICELDRQRNRLNCKVRVSNIPSNFLGWKVPSKCRFNLKSSITQLGVDAENVEVAMNESTLTAQVSLSLIPIAPLGRLALDYIEVGCIVGKLFAPVTARRVRDVAYIERLFDVCDDRGRPLFFVENKDCNLEQVDGRVIGWVHLKPGVYTYDSDVHGFLPTIGKAMKTSRKYKDLLRLHQTHREHLTSVAQPNMMLMVRTVGWHMRTMFAKVVPELLPKGVTCAHSDVVEPHDTDTVEVSEGRTIILHGSSDEEVTKIPFEFYTVEPYREHVALEQRRTLPSCIAQYDTIARAFGTIPAECRKLQSSVFITKGSQFNTLTTNDWVISDPQKVEFVGVRQHSLQHKQATSYLFQQSQYSLLSALQLGDITSDGVLLTRYFPSPILKGMILSRAVAKRLRAIIFVHASREFGSFLSQDDRSMLCDLDTFGISVFLADEETKILYEFVRRPGMDNGLFVPSHMKDAYLEATFFGVYGSNLVEGDFEGELRQLLEGVIALKAKATHQMLNKDKPLALVTGGGPGAMEVGNRVAKNVGMLSCGMFVDFQAGARKAGAVINEQKRNPYVEAFMTYRLEKLVERQSDFNLDFPIFLTGGVGTDFEYALEEVRRKVGTGPVTPLILFGTAEHWGGKITGRFLENRRSGTIKGSEWLSNIPHVCATWRHALAVYTKFFNGTLETGGKFPGNDLGFVEVDDAFVKEALGA